MAIENNDIKSLANAAKALPLQSLIGGPLEACVQAQAQAAEATQRYIWGTGFRPVDAANTEFEAVTVSFSFTQNGVLKMLTVPLLTIVPIPYMQIDTVKIRFNADMSVDNNGNLMAKYSTDTATIEKQSVSKYSLHNNLNVEVVASGHSMPEGVNKMLELLGNCMEIKDILPISARVIYLDEKTKSAIVYVGDVESEDKLTCDGAYKKSWNKYKGMAMLEFREKGDFVITSGGRSAVVTVK
ncbi:MAG: DUF2589 domain-containing protein [Bacteroidales bacterium]|nr:DUF2589 domain-containing protein [Bacteroidales bacterium]